MEVKPGQGSDSIHGNCSGNNCSHFFLLLLLLLFFVRRDVVVVTFYIISYRIHIRAYIRKCTPKRTAYIHISCYQLFYSHTHSQFFPSVSRFLFFLSRSLLAAWHKAIVFFRAALTCYFTVLLQPAIVIIANNSFFAFTQMQFYFHAFPVAELLFIEIIGKANGFQQLWHFQSFNHSKRVRVHENLYSNKDCSIYSSLFFVTIPHFTVRWTASDVFV